MADYTFLSELGSGSNGTVYKVKHNSTGSFYVIKKVNLKNQNEEIIKYAMMEVQIMKKIRHPNIVRFYGSSIVNEELHILMEYVNGGDLADMI